MEEGIKFLTIKYCFVYCYLLLTFGRSMLNCIVYIYMTSKIGRSFQETYKIDKVIENVAYKLNEKRVSKNN